MTSMKKHWLLGLLVVGVMAGATLPASAQTVLAGFEGVTPFASPTSTIPPVTIARLGDTGVANSSFGIAGTEGTQFAALTTFSNGNGTYAPGSPLYGGSGAVSSGALWGFMFPGSTINSLAAANVVTGSAMTFSLSMIAGSTLSFDYLFLTSEESSGGNADPAFVGVRAGTTGNPLLFQSLATPSSVLVDTPSAVTNFDYKNAAWGTFSYTAPATGTYTLAVGVGDNTLEGVQSGVLVDRVTFNAVPEPGTNLGIIVGVGLIGFSLRRQPRQAKG